MGYCLPKEAFSFLMVFSQADVSLHLADEFDAKVIIIFPFSALQNSSSWKFFHFQQQQMALEMA